MAWLTDGQNTPRRITGDRSIRGARADSAQAVLDGCPAMGDVSPSSNAADGLLACGAKIALIHRRIHRAALRQKSTRDG